MFVSPAVFVMLALVYCLLSFLVAE